MWFEPRTIYTIGRQIYNERDFGQVFVKAWVRDAQSDGILLDGQILAESSDNLGRFKFDWRLPDDHTGQGRQLRVTTVVYTDDTYSERNANYEIEESDVLVRSAIFGGMGSVDVDYKKIRKMVGQEIDERLEKQKPAESIDYVKLAETVTRFLPLQKEVDFGNVLKKIDSIIIPKPEKLNLNPVIERINEIEPPISYDKELEDLQRDVDKLKEGINRIITMLPSMELIKFKDKLVIKQAISEVPVVKVLNRLLDLTTDKNE
jgi:hypothetical protein